MFENDQPPDDVNTAVATTNHSNILDDCKISPEMALWSSELRATTRCLAETLTRADVLTAPAARRRLAARKLEMAAAAVSAGVEHHHHQMTTENLTDYVPPRQLLMYLIRMGSFNSSPKILNSDCQDDDFRLPSRKMSLSSVVEYCKQKRNGLPELLGREYAPLGTNALVQQKSSRFFNEEICTLSTDKVCLPFSNTGVLRVFQWNVLSQALGVHGDGFLLCPAEALDWHTRKYGMLQAILETRPDVVCLQEVDHFNFLQRSLGSLGYNGMFREKPDSPCLYMPDNNGPDGCAIFYREDKLRLLKADTKILEIWKMPTNQVVIAATFKVLDTDDEICVATTHLKARRGSLMNKLRDEQGKDLLEFVKQHCDNKPLVLCGDFNAEPEEPVYQRILSHQELGLASAYAEMASYPLGCRPDLPREREPPYTTWKIREEAEECHTIDYIYYSKNAFSVEAGLLFPSEREIGPARLPSYSYPSDHMSLMCDLRLSKED